MRLLCVGFTFKVARNDERNRHAESAAKPKRLAGDIKYFFYHEEQVNQAGLHGIQAKREPVEGPRHDEGGKRERYHPSHEACLAE